MARSKEIVYPSVFAPVYVELPETNGGIKSSDLQKMRAFFEKHSKLSYLNNGQDQNHGSVMKYIINNWDKIVSQGKGNVPENIFCFPEVSVPDPQDSYKIPAIDCIGYGGNGTVFAMEIYSLVHKKGKLNQLGRNLRILREKFPTANFNGILVGYRFIQKGLEVKLTFPEI